MFDFGVFNSIFSPVKNRQQFTRPAEASISPIVDIAMKVNKIQEDDLQPLKELSARIARALKKIGKLETSRHRAAVAVRLENLDLMEDIRLLMQLKNYSPVSTGTQTFIENKKPCRVRFVIPPVTWEEETINEIWMYPKIIIPYFSKIWVIAKFIIKHLKNPVILHKIAAKIYVGFGKLIQITTTMDIPNNTTTINFRVFPRHTT
ncbi:uncharacterized protein LOC100571417 [Acyrthosiphon pisum]|uniref:Uncharacterized protein n=1 Tax=Acyrthosiphon pisum TaxID=7029 RepID=A0A8R2D305_ACYPI|nr:uncharacterized protein LOC100571417 [Acyrthosiphon pisum]|eukprot:XP_016658236.1 PREDICTED: uncharacterized protein LOC100571417 [Acyrthosiphon pisum]